MSWVLVGTELSYVKTFRTKWAFCFRLLTVKVSRMRWEKRRGQLRWQEEDSLVGDPDRDDLCRRDRSPPGSTRGWAKPSRQRQSELLSSVAGFDFDCLGDRYEVLDYDKLRWREILKTTCRFLFKDFSLKSTCQNPSAVGLSAYKG